MFIPELVHNLASAFALRAPSSNGRISGHAVIVIIMYKTIVLYKASVFTSTSLGGMRGATIQ